MEKKKLLLVAVSVGVFLVIVLGAAILVFSPKNAVSAAGPAALSAIPGRMPVTPAETAPILPNQPASMDPADLVRNPDSIQGLQAPPALPQEDNNYFLNSENQRQPLILTEPAPAGSSGGSNTVISVPQPVIAGIPEVPPAGASASNAPARPAAQTAPAAAAPVPDVPAPAAAPAPAAQAAPPAAAQPTPAARPPSAPAVPPRPKVSTPAARSTPVASRTTKATVQPLAGRNNYWVQTGSFSTKTRAEGAKDMLAAKGITPIIENRDVNGKTFFRVRVGPYTSQNEADYWLALIKNISGFEESQIWISQSRP